MLIHAAASGRIVSRSSICWCSCSFCCQTYLNEPLFTDSDVKQTGSQFTDVDLSTLIS